MQSINKLINPEETVTEFFIEQSANIFFDIGKKATANIFFFMAGQDVNLTVRLIGENAHVNIKAVYLSDTHQDNKLNVSVEHKAQKTFSSQLIKGIGKGNSYSNFYGVIKIPKDSQQCEGVQTHKALLLSDDAVIKAIPELEIYADDIKCAHGSSIGNLDKNVLFYLQSRGINEVEAKRILIKAFLLSDMPTEFEQYIIQGMNSHE